MTDIVFRSARAEEDLIDIWTYIAADSERAADRLLDRLENRWRLLATQPRSGRMRADLGLELRQIATGSYLTFYRVFDGGIEVVRVIHGKRNIQADDFE